MHNVYERELSTAAARSCQRRAARAAVDNSLASAVLASVVWGKFIALTARGCVQPVRVLLEGARQRSDSALVVSKAY